MRRRLPTFFVAASAILCIASCVLYVRSYRVAGGRLWTTVADVAKTRLILVRRGEIEFHQFIHRAWVKSPSEEWISEPAEPAESYVSPSGLKVKSSWSFLGFEYRHASEPRSNLLKDQLDVKAPLWLLVIATMLPPLLLVRNRVRQNMRCHGAHRCVICGYDLRATPRRCPECGAVAKAIA